MYCLEKGAQDKLYKQMYDIQEKYESQECIDHIGGYLEDLEESAKNIESSNKRILVN